MLRNLGSATALTSSAASLHASAAGRALETIARPVGFLAIADRIRLAIVTNPLAIDGEIVTISASVGVSFTANAGHDLQRLCREADAALYCAKRAGRNRVVSDAEDGDRRRA